jgi:hypothetical protein
MPTLAQLQNSQAGAWGSKDNPLTDPNVQASAAGTNTFTYPITRVSGTAAMVNITVPYPGFSGKITLLPTGVFTWTAAGNIALAGSAVVGKALDFTYDPVAAKWYPSYIA